MPREGAARGWFAEIAGVLLLVIGIGLVFYEIYTQNPLAVPLNDYTFAGIGAAGIGAAALAIGLDRGAPRRG